MAIIAVVNRKGGCGKSTMAVHLASHLAHEGHPVLLCDMDRNRSASSWLRVRQAAGPGSLRPIQGHVIESGRIFLRPPGFTHIVIDTPGGMSGFELSRVACYADAILMPVGAGRFDRETAAATRGELSCTPRVASGRCKLAAVGMRVGSRNNATAILRHWAAEQGLPLIGMLRDAPVYSTCVERGYSVFDMEPELVARELQQWAPLLAWLQPLVQAAVIGEASARRPFSATASVLKPRALGTALGDAAARREQSGVRPPGPPVLSGRLPGAPPLVRAEQARVPARPSGWGQRLGQMLQGGPLQRLLARGS